ncbi:MAG: hypothetical protein SXQ77_07565, partial [Halobacteria archaeon]|nr:hypothetical protein [Halobacteria archaeon]
EAAFEEKVVARLREFYGPEMVKPQYRFEESGRVADILLHGPLASFAIEIENDWEAAIKGIGQAVVYASEVGPIVPVVCLPRGHTEMPEAENVRNWGTLIVEYDEQTQEFYSGVMPR